MKSSIEAGKVRFVENQSEGVSPHY